MLRYVGLDVGTVRIGIAVSDLLNLTAQGLESYRVTGDEDQDIANILALLKPYEPYTFVVGLPRNMNGSYGPMCDKIKAFSAKLAAISGVKVIHWDERLTTVSAQRMLIDADVSRKKRRKVVDKVAAVFILEGFLGSL